MLSLLVTAIVLLAALLGTVHLRSTKVGAIGVVLTLVAATQLVRRPLDDLGQPVLHLVYEIDEAHPVLPGPNLVDRTAQVVESRLQRLDLGRAKTRVVGPTGSSKSPTLDVLVPAGVEGAERVRRALEVVGLLEFVEVDDDKDLFSTMAADVDAGNAGLRFERENTPLGVGKTAPRYHAFLPLREHETMSAARERLDAWIGTLPVPANRRVAGETVMRLDAESGEWEDEGWRTFLLHREPFLTNRHIRDAVARPDVSTMSPGGWVVSLEFTGEGGRLFEEATARLVKRRFAIVLDGVVESAPVIQTRISGGTGVLTMGAGSPEEQATSARRLEVVLRSGALPAPLHLASEDVLPPPLSPSAFHALTVVAGLLLLAEMILALWLAFSNRGGKAPSVETPAS